MTREHRRAPASAIATSSSDRIIVRGHDLVRDLMGQLDFTSMICLHLRGEMAPPAEVAVVNAVLVSLMEHGLTPSSITARLIYGSAPEAFQGAVAAGLLGAGSQFLGSTEDAARILQDGAGEVAARREDARSYATRVIAERLNEGRTVPGFGHHIHRPDDPRVPRLLQIARDHRVADIHVDILGELSAAMDRSKGKHVTINATGAVAAVMSDLGYPCQALRGFSLIARTAGLVGHVLEEAARPINRDLWALAEREVAYDGPLPDEK